MKVTKQLVAELFQKIKDKEKLRSLLQYIFSFEYNIEVFSQVVFPDTVKDKIPDFHSDVYSFLFNDENGALAAPRGHGKTSVTGIIFLSFVIVNKLRKYIVYISQNHSKTVQFIEPIRTEFKTNRMLRFIYGDLTPTRSRDDTGKDREDCFDVGGCRVEAASFEKNIRGFKHGNNRPDLIIGDDIESDERVLNPELRVKDRNKLNNVIIPSLDINGVFKMIGTILHPNSLLVNKIKLHKGKIFKACDHQLNNILWPERFTKKKLEDIKYNIGSVSFQQEYLNDPIDNTSSVIKREHIEACRRFDLSFEDIFKMQFEMKTMGVDFAFSDRVTADESAFVGIGRKDDFYYLMHSQKEKGLSVTEQMVMIRDEFNPRYRFDKYGLEENSIKAISKDIDQWGLNITLFWTSASDPAARKKGDYDFNNKRHTVGKINLIMRLATAFENKRFILPYKTEADKLIVDKLIAECTSYALSDGKLVEAGVHPDLPIGLGYALELMNLEIESAWAFPGSSSKEALEKEPKKIYGGDEIHWETIKGQRVKMVGDRILVE